MSEQKQQTEAADGQSALTEVLGVEVRVAWAIHGDTGNGLWFPRTDKTQTALEETVKNCNAHHGRVTHWLEERTA